MESQIIFMKDDFGDGGICHEKLGVILRTEEFAWKIGSTEGFVIV